MNIHSVGQVVFDFLGSSPIRVEVVEEQLSSDAGLLPLRQFDERLGWTEGFAAQLRDGRQGHTHALVEMVRQRVFGILAGYEDQNDHDTLRSDGIFKLVAGRQPDGLDLASQPIPARRGRVWRTRSPRPICSVWKSGSSRSSSARSLSPPRS